MVLNDFKNWALASGQVGKATDGQFVGQCVSLINQYLYKVYGISAGAWGDAKDWAKDTNSVRQYFDKVGSPQAGDIGVSGPTSTNPYGHIWIYLSPTTILEQNGRVPLRVSTGSAYANPIAILRKKGTGEVVTDKDAANMLAKAVMYVEPSTVSTDYFVGKPFKDAVYLAWNTPQGKEIQHRVADWEKVNYERDALKAENEALKKQIESVGFKQADRDVLNRVDKNTGGK